MLGISLPMKKKNESTPPPPGSLIQVVYTMKEMDW